MSFTYSPCVCLGFLHIPQFNLTSQKHTARGTVYLNCSLDVNDFVCVCVFMNAHK